MKDNSDADNLSNLVVKRRFPFARELVFDAWTRKEHLHRWMGPTPDIVAEFIEIDFRQGGHYRFGFVEAGEPIKYVRGVYLEIRRPERLKFTWVWDQPQIDAGVETLVTVDFRDIAQGTEMVLRHQKFASEEACELHTGGWAGTFDKLSEHLADTRD